MNVQPGFSFEAVIDCGTTGLVGTIGLELHDNVGGIIWPFSTSGIIEIAPGVYSVVKIAPMTFGQYTLIWLDSPGGTVLGVEDLVVTVEPLIPIGPQPLPPVTGGMTFKQLQDECVVFRFGEGRRESVKMWLNRRMQAVWGESEWPFKRVNKQTVTIADSGYLFMPVGFRRAIALEAFDGTPLEFLDPEQFRAAFPVLGTGGMPSTYTVWNSQVLFDSAVAEATPFYLSYQRRVCVRDGNGALREGLMQDDNDQPIWDPEHHFMLVMGACSTGLKLENDFTWNSLEDEFQMALTEMKDDILPPDTVGTSQYGADNLS